MAKLLRIRSLSLPSTPRPHKATPHAPGRTRGLLDPLKQFFGTFIPSKIYRLPLIPKRTASTRLIIILLPLAVFTSAGGISLNCSVYSIHTAYISAILRHNPTWSLPVLGANCSAAASTHPLKAPPVISLLVDDAPRAPHLSSAVLELYISRRRSASSTSSTTATRYAICLPPPPLPPCPLLPVARHRPLYTSTSPVTSTPPPLSPPC
jgi:hypothetical protein